MASGWANDDAVNEQINNTIEDAVARARGELPTGESLHECEECGNPIPQARREAVPGVRLCISCQQDKDSHNSAFSGYNRRGSKDSQLRSLIFTKSFSAYDFLYKHAFSLAV